MQNLGERTRDMLLGLAHRRWKLAAGEGGQNLVEVALIVALVAFGCAATMTSLASGINTEFTTIISVIDSALG